MRSRPLAMEQEAAELVLQELDGTRERWLRHVAFLGRAGEVQLSAQGEEIPDLMHFHGIASQCTVTSRPRFGLPNHRGRAISQLVVAATNPALAGLGRPAGDFNPGAARKLQSAFDASEI
jgi:hypothetical protein